MRSLSRPARLLPGLLLLLGLGSSGCGHALTGLGSWYGGKFHGRRTASGEIYDSRQLTAAHRTLPFGTVVRVTHPKNGRHITVRITDRGPYGPGRVIDLSPAAFARIAPLRAGVIPVRLRVLSWGDGRYRRGQRARVAAGARPPAAAPSSAAATPLRGRPAPRRRWRRVHAPLLGRAPTP